MRPNIQEQIKDAEDSSQKYPELKGIICVHKEILRILLPLESHHGKGIEIDLEDAEILKHLEEQCLKSGAPISHYLATKNFREDILDTVFNNLIELCTNVKSDVDSDFSKIRTAAMDEKKFNIVQSLRALLKTDIDWFQNEAFRMNVNPGMLVFLAGQLVKPAVEHIGRHLSAELTRKWNKGICPVCGSVPDIARVRTELSKWYLVCKLCGVERLQDPFYCPVCEIIEPYNFRTRVFDEMPNLSLRICTKCGHRVKVINDFKSQYPIPKGLEEIFTAPLEHNIGDYKTISS